MTQRHLFEEDTNMMTMQHVSDEYEIEEASEYGDPMLYLMALQEAAMRADEMTLNNQPSNI